MSSAKILVVDDDPEIVRLLTGYLRREGYTLLRAYSGREALRLLRDEHPDLLIVDLMLPDTDGWMITQEVREDPALAELPIMMLTARVDDRDKILGLELGADDYITKPFNPREVVARAKARLRRPRTGVGPAGPLIAGDVQLDVERRELRCGGASVDLTPIQFKLLQLFMENQGVAFSRAELIERSLGLEYVGMERTLDSHIKNLRRKIEQEPHGWRYIHTVYGVGYRFAAERDG